LSIKIHYDNVKYRIHKTTEIKRFLEKVITDENKKPGDLVFILTGDKSLLKMNRQYLKHDYFTDVISFDYSEEGTVNGEIYMSIDTIRSNAGRFKTDIKEELLRVMIHGVLHLCGFRDESVKDRKEMFRRQEMRLKEFEISQR
jgi:probable rRNA maturation factor